MIELYDLRDAGRSLSRYLEKRKPVLYRSDSICFSGYIPDGLHYGKNADHKTVRKKSRQSACNMGHKPHFAAVCKKYLRFAGSECDSTGFPEKRITDRSMYIRIQPPLYYRDGSGMSCGCVAFDE